MTLGENGLVIVSRVLVSVRVGSVLGSGLGQGHGCVSVRVSVKVRVVSVLGSGSVFGSESGLGQCWGKGQGHVGSGSCLVRVGLGSVLGHGRVKA